MCRLRQLLWIFLLTAGLAGPVLAEVTPGDYIKASNTGSDLFGAAVALDGDTLVVGAPWERSNGSSQTNDSLLNAGAAYVFVHENGSWRQQAYLKAPTPTSGGFFGNAVDISGDTLIVSHRGDATDFFLGGAAHIFVRSGETWTLQATLRASQPGMGQFFGGQVAIDGETALVAEPVRKMVTVFVRSGTTWTRQQEILLNDGDIDGITSVDISGDTLVAGSANRNQAYVYTRAGSDWTKRATLASPIQPAPEFNQFGFSARIDDDTIVIGAEGESRAYVFTPSGASWAEQAVLTASNFDASDKFGHALAISGDRIVIGAYGESSPATGVNGSQGDDENFSFSGAAYVFRADGANWTQEAYLKASNPAMNYYFGVSVAVSNKFVASGAEERGASTGVNGDQTDQSISDAGAVYTFNLPQNPRVNWVNPAGGNWDQESNWSPAVVPGATTDLLFNLPDSYDVQVGTSQAANVDVENGSVGFKGTLLELGGALRVSNQAYLTLPEGNLEATETVVGFLPPTDPANPQTAHLNIFNEGTFLNTTLLKVGGAAPAELFVSNGARLSSRIASIGIGASGAVIVGEDAQWVSESLELSGPAVARLDIEAGGVMFNLGDAVIGGQTSDPENASAVLAIKGWNIDRTRSSQLYVDGNIKIGDGIFTVVNLRDAAKLEAINLIFGVRSEAYAELYGKSTLSVLQDLTVGHEAVASMVIREGTTASVADDLVIGEFADGYVDISGSDSEFAGPSELTVGDECIIGMFGLGVVDVYQAGRLQCASLLVGTRTAGTGTLNVGNEDGPGFVEAGELAIGLDDAEGRIVMQSGVIATEGLTNYSSGQISGTGKIVVGELGLLNNGTITVGDSQEPEVPAGAQALRVLSSSEFQPGTLEIDGDLVLGEGSRLVIDVAGGNPDQHDHLVVNGELTLGGELIVNFSNGYQPADDAILNLLHVQGQSGEFDRVVINGLPSGHELNTGFVQVREAPPQGEDWPAPYRGVTPDQSLELGLNTISYFDPQDGLIHACINVLYDGIPGTFGGYSRYAIAYEIVDLGNAVIGVNSVGIFNATNALTEAGELPDCSGSVDLVTGVYADFIQVNDVVFDAEFILTDPERLHFTASRVALAGEQ